jgi:hypothetical protein
LSTSGQSDQQQLIELRTSFKTTIPRTLRRRFRLTSSLLRIDQPVVVFFLYPFAEGRLPKPLHFGEPDVTAPIAAAARELCGKLDDDGMK